MNRITWVCHATWRAGVHRTGRLRPGRMPIAQAGRMRVKDAVGRYGEQVAAEHLEAAGLRILVRNWRCRDGELDIVAVDGAALVVVEVKTRSSPAYGRPAEAVNRLKIARIRRLTILWMAEHRDVGTWPTVRFDVVGVLRQRSGPPQVEHIRAAF